MKASELIEELKRSIEYFGDWNVVAGIKRESVYDEETGELLLEPQQYPVTTIRISATKDGQRKRYIIE